MTYPQVYSSQTGQWTSLFEEAVTIENVGGIDLTNPQDNDILTYNSACANFINGDDKAEQALKAAGKLHYVAVAHAILGRIHEDGDRNTTPTGVIKNMLNFKKAFQK